MGSDRERFCDYCKHYMCDYDLCTLSGRKPSFESECANYDEKKDAVKKKEAVKKDVVKKKDAVKKKNSKKIDGDPRRNVFMAIKMLAMIAFIIFVLPDRCGIKDKIDILINGEQEPPPLPEIPDPKIPPIDISNGNNKSGFTIKGDTGQSHMNFSGGKSYGSGINVQVPEGEGKLMKYTPQGNLNHTNSTQIANPLPTSVPTFNNANTSKDYLTTPKLTTYPTNESARLKFK